MIETERGVSCTVVERHHSPVLTIDTPDAAGIRYGFEGGRCVKLGTTYHLFISEMAGSPRWVKMRLGHWTSGDRHSWKRVSTLFESSGDYTGADPRACLWAPVPTYDEADGRWNLTYVAYRSAPVTLNGLGIVEAGLNYGGRIWRAVSTAAGPEGIGGPYRDIGILLEPSGQSDPWEGLQGTDSFCPYRIGDRWYAFYGSANTEETPCPYWRVGLAEAPQLAGPWARVVGRNPLTFEPRFIENPVVTCLRDGTYVAVYDTGLNHPLALGWAYSSDGLEWTRGDPIVLEHGGGVEGWVALARTPLGLIPEDDGTCTLFYTGYQRTPGDGIAVLASSEEPCAVGFVRVTLERQAQP